MQTASQIFIFILCLSIVGLMWAMIQKFTNLLFANNSKDMKREWKELGIGIAALACLVAVTAGIAYLAGI